MIESIGGAASLPDTIPASGLLRAEQLRRTYVRGKEEVQACKNLTFSIKKGEFVCIVGPSGCGKTALLKCICHLRKPAAGKVFVNDREILSPPKEMTLIFQDYSRSLFPWRTVLKNVFFALEKKNMTRKERANVARSALNAVRIMISSWFAKKSLLDKNKEKTTRFLAAIKKATDYINSHPGESPAIVAKFTKLDVNLLKKITPTKFYTKLSKKDIQVQIDLCAKYGFIKKGFDAKDIVATNLVPLE